MFSLRARSRASLRWLCTYQHRCTAGQTAGISPGETKSDKRPKLSHRDEALEGSRSGGIGLGVTWSSCSKLAVGWDWWSLRSLLTQTSLGFCIKIWANTCSLHQSLHAQTQLLMPSTCSAPTEPQIPVPGMSRLRSPALGHSCPRRSRCHRDTWGRWSLPPEDTRGALEGHRIDTAEPAPFTFPLI